MANSNKRSRGIQTIIANGSQIKVDRSVQTLQIAPSYSRSIKHFNNNTFTTHKYLLENILPNDETIFNWCFENNLIAKSRQCMKCGDEIHLSKCSKSSDGLRWRCQRNKHSSQESVRKGSWFEKSNLTISEIIELTYWWTIEVDQHQMAMQMSVSSATAVVWSMLCREICEIVLFQGSQPIGGPGVCVQIDESKFGKRKYHRGHKVEGQWVFGGIEENSRKNFMVAVEKRDRETLLPIIQRWILPGSIIISDCWKPYDILSDCDYTHLRVNHSIEFVNENGDHTNKIEGHWRQAKNHFPSFGVRKHHFSSYLAEFMWRYQNKEMNLFNAFVQDIAKVYKF